MTIFKSNSQPSNDECESHEHDDCISIQRLMACLKYYTKLDIHTDKNKDNIDIFCNFIEEIYKYQIYDDYHHLVRYHQNELSQIMKELTECDLKSCHFADRHYRVNESPTNAVDTEEFPYLQSYVEVMDSLHFYIHHLEDSSLRVGTDQRIIKEGEDKKQEDMDHNEYFDAKLSRINRRVQKGRSATNRFSRLSGNKFNISVTNEQDIKHQVIEIEPEFEPEVHCGNNIVIKHKHTPFYSVAVDADDEHVDFDTYLDTFYSNLQNNKVSGDLLELLHEIIIDEEYCTESLDYDLDIFKTDGVSNVTAKLQNDSDVQQIVTCFKASEGMSLLFNLCLNNFTTYITYR